jgi:hypothetical protein
MYRCVHRSGGRVRNLIDVDFLVNGRREEPLAGRGVRFDAIIVKQGSRLTREISPDD